MSTTPEDAATPEAEAPHVAKVGVIDTGHNVTSFNPDSKLLVQPLQQPHF